MDNQAILSSRLHTRIYRTIKKTEYSEKWMLVIDERSHMLTRDIIESLISEHVLFLN